MARSSAGFTLRAGSMLNRLSGARAHIAKHSTGRMEEAATLLQTEIQNRAPVDTGHLRDSYDVRIESTSDGAVGHVWSDVPYAAAQEYGTSYQPGTPHVRPAVEARKDDIVDIIAHQAMTDAWQA